MTAVIREVLFELKGRKDQLDATLVQTQGNLARTKASAEGVGGAGEQMGRKFEMGARQIASAAETMARTGKIGGEAGKTMLGAASNIALGFGPGGIAIGALSIFGLATYTIFSRARAEARETREEFEKTLRVISATRDYKGAVAAFVKAGFGDPSAEDEFDRMGFLPLEARIKQFREARRRALPGGGFEIATTRGEQLELERMVAALERLRPLYEAAKKAADDLAQGERERLATGAKLESDEEAAKAAKRAREEAKKAGEAWVEAYDKAVLGALGTTAEIAAGEINRAIEEGIKLGADPEQIAQLRRLSAQAYTAAEGVAELKQAWMDYESGASATGTSAVERGANALAALQSAIANAGERLKHLTKGSEGYNRVLREQHELQQKLNKLTGLDDGTKPPKVADPIKETALQLQQAADGALQLAQNLFGAEAGAIGTLRAVSQIAGNIGALKTAFGEGGSLLGKVSGVLGILGAVSSLLRDPADAERARAINENTLALKELTEKAGLLGVGITGASAARSASGLAGFLSQQRLHLIAAGGELYNADDQARVAAKAFGLDIRELEAIAKEYGIELNGNIESFRQLYEAIQDTITKLGEFGTDLESQRQQADAYARVFGVTDPSELLGLTRGTYGGRSPALDAALGGLDLSTPEGRQAAREALQGLFTTLMAGGGTLSAGQLGGLTGDELLQAILDLIDGLNAVDESQGTSSITNADQVITADRTQITADQASRLLGVNTTMEIHLRAIRQIMEEARSPIPVPSLGAGFSQVGGASVVITISQEFYGAVNPREVSQSVGDATVDAIDRAFGQRVLVRKRYLGQAVTK